MKLNKGYLNVEEFDPRSKIHEVFLHYTDMMLMKSAGFLLDNPLPFLCKPFAEGQHNGDVRGDRVGAWPEEHPPDRDVVGAVQPQLLLGLLRLRHGPPLHQVHARHAALLVQAHVRRRRRPVHIHVRLHSLNYQSTVFTCKLSMAF